MADHQCPTCDQILPPLAEPPKCPRCEKEMIRCTLSSKWNRDDDCDRDPYYHYWYCGDGPGACGKYVPRRE